MKKMIHEVYRYFDYRVLLNDDFFERVAINHSYSLRSHAQKLQLSPGFLSQVMRGLKQLSANRVPKIFSTLGFEPNEIEYIKNLVKMKMAKSEADRFQARNFVMQIYPNRAFPVDKSKNLIGLNLDYFLVYGFIRGIESIDKVQLLANKIGIGEDKFNQIVSHFISEGYIKENNGKLQVIDRDMTIDADDERLKMLGEMSHAIMKLVRDKGGIKVPERVCHGFVIPMNQKSFELIHETHKQFIKNLLHISKQVENADRFMLLTDFLYVIESFRN